MSERPRDFAAGLVHTEGGAYLPGGSVGGSSVCSRSQRAEKLRYLGRGNGIGALSGGWVADGVCQDPETPTGRDAEGVRAIVADALGRRFLVGEVVGGEHATSAQELEVVLPRMIRGSSGLIPVATVAAG